MDNFIFSLNVTIPIFLVILLGYILRKIGLINENFVSIANKYVFKCALPVMLFQDIAFTDTLRSAKGSFVLFCALVTIAMFLLVWLCSYVFLKDKSLVGAFAQAGARGSAAILGVAFVENISGSAGMAPLMIVSAVPFFNILSVIILTFSADLNKSAGEKKSHGAVIKKSLFNIVTNPIIIGILLGIPFALLNVKFPAIATRTMDYVARTATPVALIAIGGGFDKQEATRRVKPAIWASLIKLVILPAVFLPLAVLFHFASSEMVAILIMLASPTTVSCYIMAVNMENDGPLTSNVILLTTIFSSLTLTGWIFILRSFNLI
ncbi:MAG: AEC family transporter [Lachnospiraceae bacterium]|nr:AEC family transporter [Lachnospiraceae bacterium]